MAAQRDPVEPLARLNSAREDGLRRARRGSFHRHQHASWQFVLRFPLPPHAHFAYERVVNVGFGKELQDVRFERTRLRASCPFLRYSRASCALVRIQRLTVLPIITATRSCWACQPKTIGRIGVS
jgi:hypothetical protein